jgi:hypothetical protein
MRRIRTTLVLIVLLALATPACAGDAKAPAGPPKTSADVVKVVAVPATLTAKTGATITFEVKVEIAKHWHLYSHSYAEDPESMYIGIALAAGDTFPLTNLKVVYPEAVKGSFLGEEVLMHAGTFALKVTATVPAGAKGELSAPLSLTVQACDDKVCLRPADLPVTVKVTVQ